jgi:hypothetical protein
MPATITKAFIPRILCNVTVSQIRDVFAAKQIGKIKNIDMHRRKNDKNNQYSFAFIEFALYDTKEATVLCEEILDNGSSKVFYDRKNYWEVKAFLPKNQRDSVMAFLEEPEIIAKEESPSEEFDEIQTICADLLTPTFSYEVAWQRMSVHSELLHAHHTREVEQKTCYNCGSTSKPECASSIFWKNYSFCSDRCQWETESDIRKSWRKSQEPALPEFNLMMDDSTASKFITMFQRIQDEAATEIQSIRSLCYELIKRPTVFTNKDREEMAREYEALQKEIIA